MYRYQASQIRSPARNHPPGLSSSLLIRLYRLGRPVVRIVPFLTPNPYCILICKPYRVQVCHRVQVVVHRGADVPMLYMPPKHKEKERLDQSKCEEEPARKRKAWAIQAFRMCATGRSTPAAVAAAAAASAADLNLCLSTRDTVKLWLEGAASQRKNGYGSQTSLQACKQAPSQQTTRNQMNKIPSAVPFIASHSPCNAEAVVEC
eukprot:1138702-Pelagomonas_calceolata.AAC.8